MLFDVKTELWVEESDLKKMKRLVDEGISPEEAFDNVSCGWDDCDYVLCDFVKDEIIEYFMPHDWE